MLSRGLLSKVQYGRVISSQRALQPSILSFVRARSDLGSKKGSDRPWSTQKSSNFKQHRRRPSPPRILEPESLRLPLKHSFVPIHLSNVCEDWITLPAVRQRLMRFGIPGNQITYALKAFHVALRKQEVLTALEYDEEQIDRLAHDLSDPNKFEPGDITLTRLLFEWAASAHGKEQLRALLPSTTLLRMNELFHSADLSDPAAAFTSTRVSPPRKVIMHVGPTNSGKTHNALQALAAAKTGVYAGPLRLLAHEIWERLNKGQIVPLGMEPDPDAEPDEDTNMAVVMDVHGKPVVQKKANSKFARVCNLITGEEQRILDENCGLASCTVEMIGFTSAVDVAVIDEIQMIASPDRGGAWLDAILGLNARELHVCGEETAVPLVQRLLRDTGDEIIVNRYKRLTPLHVSKESLNGDIKNVETGDCVVSFSRSGIFKLKKDIEMGTGMKCAVAYGRLPPEIRSEQAHLFNNTESGYDVLIGSDAIGMGLNLKIKRIVFEAITKYHGPTEGEHLISISQFKQIAGRAGRFGLHDDETPGGFATTLHKEDLPILRKALRFLPTPLRLARINASLEKFEEVIQALPPNSASSTAMEVFKYVSKMHTCCEYMDVESLFKIVDSIDRAVGELSTADKFMLQRSPVPWRDNKAVEVIIDLMKTYRTDFEVDIQKVVTESGLLDRLQEAQRAREVNDLRKTNVEVLAQLELLHKVVIVYLWLSYRNVVAFRQRDRATELKIATEDVMNWVLETMGKKRAHARLVKMKNSGLESNEAEIEEVSAQSQPSLQSQ
ncbi:P-loop containing nucleoside triphosphate hydrolase protein [Abortiporus biennis]|nr:P-loop containing nucleoside triphosphate hydrolase protein [Abortiporus biennis]